MPRINSRKCFQKLEGNYIVGRVNEETGDTEYYVGETEDLFRRLIEHKSNGWGLVSFLSNLGGKAARVEVETVQIEAMEDGGHTDVVNLRGRRRRGR